MGFVFMGESDSASAGGDQRLHKRIKKAPAGEEDRQVLFLLTITGRRSDDGLFRQDREEDYPYRNSWSSDRLARDERNVGTGNAQIVQFAGRQAIQLVDRIAITPPIAELTYDVHCSNLSQTLVNLFGTVCRCSNERKIGRSQTGLESQICRAAMRIVQCSIHKNFTQP